MALVIPDIQAPPTYDGQSVSDATDWSAQSASENGTGVIAGCNVVALASPAMGASINSGTYMISGLQYTYAGGSVSITSASASDRRDIITISSTSPSVTAGTPCGTAAWSRSSSGLPPVKPNIPSNNVLLGEVYVQASAGSITSGNIVDKTTILAGTPGSLIARGVYAPSSASACPVTAASVGLTAIARFNLSVTFVVPPSGDVWVRQTGFCKGGAAAATAFIFGIVSSTASPGTLVGTVGLASLNPTATAADNGDLASMSQLITGLTPGATLTWFFGASWSVGVAPTIVAQGGSSNTTVPTGAPLTLEVWAA